MGLLEERKMEFNCPTCQTKLGVSDELVNPKVRCRECGTIFRPRESGGASQPTSPSQASPYLSQESPYPDDPEPTAYTSPFDAKSPPEVDDFTPATSPAPIPERPIVTERPQQERRKGGGWGIAIFIIFILLTRVPRMWRNFQRDPAPPAPIEIDHDELRQRLDKIIEESRRIENEGLPQLPEGADPTDINSELESP